MPISWGGSTPLIIFFFSSFFPNMANTKNINSNKKRSSIDFPVKRSTKFCVTIPKMPQRGDSKWPHFSPCIKTDLMGGNAVFFDIFLMLPTRVTRRDANYYRIPFYTVISIYLSMDSFPPSRSLFTGNTITCALSYLFSMWSRIDKWQKMYI